MSHEEADVRILFLGNSHTFMHNLPMVVGAMIDADADPDLAYVESVAYPDAFLVDHLDSERSMKALKEKKWDYVVLQGQKYSTSGKYSYPHDAAIEITKLVKEQGGQVVMYPEWRRKGHPEEGVRVQKLHEQIASETGAIVAPVGLAWDKALEASSDLKLHAPDGNHCTRLGAFLTACVIYGTITERDIEELDEDGRLGIDKSDRDMLQEVADKIVKR